MSSTQDSQYGNAQQRAAQDASAEAAMDPANLELLNKDIARLTGKTEETQNKFIDIGGQLIQLDSILLKDGKPFSKTVKFKASWNKHLDTFNSLVQLSNQSAITIATFCDKFSKLELPMYTDKMEKVMLSDNDKLKTLDVAIKNIRNQSSDYTKDGFKELTERIAALAKELHDIASKRLNVSETEIKRLNTDIAKLHNEIAILNEKIDKQTARLGLGFVATIFAKLFPTYGDTIMKVGATAAGDKTSKIPDMKTEVAEKRLRVRELELKKTDLFDEVDVLQKVQAALCEVQDGDLDVVVNALSSFDVVKDQLVTDCEAIKAYIANGKEESEMPNAVATYLSTGKCLYAPLAKGIKDYANGQKK